MCEIGDFDDVCSVWSEREVCARKMARCWCCGGGIAVGDRYVAHFSVSDGMPNYEKLCLPCHDDRTAFGREHHIGDCSPSYFQQLLVNCIGDGDAESDARWQPVLAAMAARRERYETASAL